MSLLVKNRFLELVHSGKVVISLTVKACRSEIVPIAKGTGCDGLFIDGEHSALTSESIVSLCMSSLGHGITPLVRVPSCDSPLTLKAVDGGAQGIIFPHIKTKVDVEKCVAATKFAPLGNRSVNMAFPQFSYTSVPYDEAVNHINSTTMVIPMVETNEALENIEAISDVRGIDAILIGASDLSSELGIPNQFDNDIFLNACNKVINVCKAKNVIVGVGGVQNHPDTVRYLTSQGAQWFLGPQDISCLAKECKNHMNSLIQATANN